MQAILLNHVAISRAIFNIILIFISLTTKDKVSIEGNKAYRGVTYKEDHIQTLD